MPNIFMDMIIQNYILDYLKRRPNSSSKEIHEGIDNAISYTTVKRQIANLKCIRLSVASEK